MATDAAPPITLPDDPSIEQLRKQARELRDELRRDDPSVKLSTAQRLVARKYGFPSWPKLVRHLEVVARYSWRPDDERGVADSPADAFLRFACLTYTDDDGPARWQRARELLEREPGIGRATVHAAAACSDGDAVRAMLAEDPALARQEGGPYRWEPLMYLTYARHWAQTAEGETLASARALLDHGADPNVGYLWHGMPSPFTALTGTFGEGELGPVRQPRHPHSIALARTLLAAGADPNDPQALYNRMFGDDDDHLVLLFEFGLGRGNGGPWRERLREAIDPPEELVRGQLRWAVMHDQEARVRLLLDHGVDAEAPFADGRTVIELAALTGNTAVVSILEEHGTPAPRFDDLDAFVARVLDGDERMALTAAPELVLRARAARPGLIVWAAARANAPAVDLLLRLGFDVNALGRADVPVEHEWETALHAAVSIGDRGLVERLLAAGADVTIKDARFEATAVGWAEHFEHPDLVAVLERVTPEGSA
jgi:hypothetical protein